MVRRICSKLVLGLDRVAREGVLRRITEIGVLDSHGDNNYYRGRMGWQGKGDVP